MSVSFLELDNHCNSWSPPEIDEETMAYAVRNDSDSSQSDEFVHIFQTDPFIDFLYIQYDDERNPIHIHRFTIREGFIWSCEEEEFFHEHCIKHNRCSYAGGQIERIFQLYNAAHPEWHLQRYYTKGLRVLDHVYHCLKKNTAKEILYKSGLDEYAAGIDELDELNLLAAKPSDIYDGLTMKVLRSLHCQEGVSIVNRHDYRIYLKELNKLFPKLFEIRHNDAQCRYLRGLIDGELTAGETGRLFGARREALTNICSRSLYDVFVAKGKHELEVMKLCNLYGKMDPIYEDYIRKTSDPRNDWRLKRLEFLLLQKKEEYDTLIRRSNRKRPYDWQERGDKYYVRYPQTINDFCREAIYMQNCLMTYIDAMIHNDTTILFMRRIDDVNTPFITIEIYQNKMMQAYHRFNKDCTPEEAAWIDEYCGRHKIALNRTETPACIAARREFVQIPLL